MGVLWCCVMLPYWIHGRLWVVGERESGGGGTQCTLDGVKQEIQLEQEEIEKEQRNKIDLHWGRRGQLVDVCQCPYLYRRSQNRHGKDWFTWFAMVQRIAPTRFG